MIRIKQSKDGLYYFVVQGKNGKVMATSETYQTKRNVLRATDAICYLITNYTLKVVDETK